MKINQSDTANQVSNIQASQSLGKAMSQNDFMKIFLKQLLTQNPMKPFDNGDMMQQMSQMTSLSSIQELQNSIKLMNENLMQSQIIGASQLIGKKVAVVSDHMPLDSKEGLSGSVILPSKASVVEIEIKDKSNKIVKTISLPASERGVVDFHWDGIGSDGKPMPADTYSVSAKATMNNETKPVYTAGIFKVNSVAMNGMINVDMLGGVDMSEVIKILS